MSDCGGSCSTCTDGECRDRLPPGMLRVYDLDQEVADGILVYAEVYKADGSWRLHPAVPALVGKAAELTTGRVFAVIFGPAELKPLYEALFSYGVDTLYHMRDPKAVYSPEPYADASADLCRRVLPAAFLLPATPQGREVAPMIAARLDAGLTADCTSIVADGRTLMMTRPALGGTISATISASGFPQMATIRPGTFPDPVPEAGRKGTVVSLVLRGSGREVREVRAAEGTEDISEAKVLISLGNGVRRRESVDAAFRIAGLIGATVSCSRAMADRGWLPHSRQVGQSGKTVSPDLYMAFGISGSVQHMAGVRAKRIVSVNRDPDAPMNSSADKAIIGDADAILGSMLRSLEEGLDGGVDLS